MYRLIYLLLALILLAFFTDFQVFWGFDSLRYIDNYLVWLILVPTIILIIPPVYKRANKGLIDILPRLRNVPWFVYITLLALVFYFFRQAGFFLGDGLLRIRDLETGQIYFAAEPFDIVIHTYLFRLLNKVIAADGEFVYALVSIVSGLVSIAFSRQIIKKISNDFFERTLLWLMILSSGTIQLFFGYAESYSIINAILLPWMLYSVLLIQEKRFSYIPMILWIISIFFHPIMVILLPSILYLYYTLIRQSENRTRLLIVTAGLSIIVVSLSILALIYLGVKLDDLNRLTSGSHIKPIISNEQGYGVLSYYSLIDLFNLIILIVPSVLVLFRFDKNSGKNNTTVEKRSFIKLDSHLIFLLISTIITLIFVLIFRSGIGFSRDWDLFALLGFPATLLIYFVAKSLNFNIKGLILPLIIIIMLQTVPWIISNSNSDYALRRAVAMTESPGWSHHEKAILLGEVSHYYYSLGKLEDAIGFADKSYQHQQNERILYSLGLMYFDQADYNKAFEKFTALKSTNYKKKNVLMMLGDISFRMNNFQSAIDSYKQYLYIDSLNYGTYFNAGLAYYQLKKADSALVYFKAAAFLNKDHIPSQSMIAQIYSDLGYLDSAISYYQKLIIIEPSNPEFYYNLALCYSDNKQYDKALDNAMRAKTRGFDPKHVDGLITELKKYPVEKP